MRANPAPASVRIQIPTPDEMRAAHAAWARTALFPPRQELDLDDYELFGEIIQAVFDEAPDVDKVNWFIALHAKSRFVGGRDDIAAVFLSAGQIQFSVTGDAAYAHNVIRLGLPSFVGQRGSKGFAQNDLASTGWIVVPDTRRTQYGPPDRLLKRLGLTRSDPPDRFLTRFQTHGAMRGTADVDDPQFWIDNPGQRRLVNRPRPLPEELEDVAAGDTIAASDIPERAPAAARSRAGRAPARTKDVDMTLIYAAAAGDGAAIAKVAKHYRRFMRKMAYAFIKAWSPGMSQGVLAHQADDIAAEVEQRVFVGTPKTAAVKREEDADGKTLQRARPAYAGTGPAIKNFVVAKHRRGSGRAGFSSGAPPTTAGAESTAAFSTWLGAVIRNIARKHVDKSVRAAKGAAAGDVEESLSFEDELLQKEEAQKIRAESSKQSAAMVDALEVLGSTKSGRDETEVLRRRQKGDSYKQIAADLGISTSAVMSRLFRARKHLEEVSGIQMRGLVGELRKGFGAAVPGARGRPRKNPEAEDVDGELVYFEDVGDVFDLWEAGAFDDDTALDALDALAEYRPEAM